MHLAVLFNDLFGPLVHVVNLFYRLELSLQDLDVGLGQKLLGTEREQVRYLQRFVDIGLLDALKNALGRQNLVKNLLNGLQTKRKHSLS